jgi:hypothetical protein
MRVLTLIRIAARVANRRELQIPVLALPHLWEESRQLSLKVEIRRTSKVGSIPAEGRSWIKVFTRRFGPSDLTISI